MTKAKPAAAKPKAATPSKPVAASKRAAQDKAPVAAKQTKAPDTGKKVKVELVTLRQLAASIGEASAIPQKQAAEVLTSAVAAIGEHLKKGARIRVAGLGTFEVRKRPERTGRNPATGEPITIKASKKVAFRPAKDFSEAI
jgi:DNA-binding protein HU-beta